MHGTGSVKLKSQATHKLLAQFVCLRKPVGSHQNKAKVSAIYPMIPIPMLSWKTKDILVFRGSHTYISLHRAVYTRHEDINPF